MTETRPPPITEAECDAILTRFRPLLLTGISIAVAGGAQAAELGVLVSDDTLPGWITSGADLSGQVWSLARLRKLVSKQPLILCEPDEGELLGILIIKGQARSFTLPLGRGAN